MQITIGIWPPVGELFDHGLLSAPSGGQKSEQNRRQTPLESVISGVRLKGFGVSKGAA